MKTSVPAKVSITVYIFFTWISIGLSYYSGAWCPYQSEKIVPCRTRNGSEPYYGPNVCWRNDNGSYACTKKILYRPKYITTYKKVWETKYKCCPGRSGVDCENECFNCTTYQRLEDRVAATERRLSRLEYPKSDRSDRLNRDQISQNSVYSGASKDSALVALRLQKLFDEFRDLQNRIRLIENEMSRLNTQVDDLSLSSQDIPNHLKDKDNRVVDASPDHDHKSMPPSTPSTLTSDNPDEKRDIKGDMTFRVLEENLERGDIASTLNDDYGDELYNDNSTEQYIDQLQLKREHSP